LYIQTTGGTYGFKLSDVLIRRIGEQ
jgi:hypothetical protein